MRRDRIAIVNNSDRAVREQGFKKLYASYASQRDLYAFALVNQVEAKNRLAKLHHFEDAPAEELAYETGGTVYQIKFGQLKDYLIQQLKSPFVKMAFG